METTETRMSRSNPRAAAGGLVGGAAITILVAVAHSVAPSVPFLPESIAQSLVRAAPGGFATYFIERLGHWAIRLALAGTFAAFLGVGALVGLLIPWLMRRLSWSAWAAGVLAFAPAWAASPASGQVATISRVSRSGRFDQISSVTCGIAGCSSLSNRSSAAVAVARASVSPSYRRLFTASAYQSQKSSKMRW